MVKTLFEGQHLSDESSAFAGVAAARARWFVTVFVFAPAHLDGLTMTSWIVLPQYG